MYDFYKEFIGVDIAKVEQVTEIIGRVEAKLYLSLVGAGLDKKAAMLILHDVHTVVVRELMRPIKSKDE